MFKSSSICRSSALGHTCRIIEPHPIFLPGTPSLGITEGKRICIIIMVIDALPVLSFRVFKQLTVFLAGRKSVLTRDILCKVFHTPGNQN